VFFRAWLAMAVIPLLAITSSGAAAQAATGTLQGSVRAEQTAVPLAYAVVSLPRLNVERFTNGAGVFVLTTLPEGRHEVLIRRIGYAPYRSTVTIERGVVTRLDVQLAAIPVNIQTLTVRAMVSCTSPGVPDATRFPEVAALVALLRENADRYRLLASQYPFAYRQVRALAELENEKSPTSLVLLQRVDTILARSATRVEYRAGEVVQRVRVRGGGNEYNMAIPTILDLADNNFARAHCFAYGGKERVDDETWLRLDVRASDKLRSPDVHGAFFLDSATSQLRRMDLELSHADRLPRPLQHVASVQVRTQFLEIAPGLSIINAVCGVTRQKQSRVRGATGLPAEVQTIAAYEFETAPEGVLSFRNLPTPLWRAGMRLPRSFLWCLDAPPN
jgi:hypothetical protein